MIFNTAQLICLFFAVESPVYLLRKGFFEEARFANRMLHGENNNGLDFSENSDKVNVLIEKSDFLTETRQSWEDLKEIFVLKHIRIPTFHIMITFWNQNVTGIPALMMFSNAISQATEIPTEYIGWRV